MKASTTRRLAAGAVAVLIGLGLAGGGAVAARAATTGDVYVIQGIAGPAVDILVDGRDTATAATPKTVVGPLRLAAGNHVLALRDGTNTLVSARFTVNAGTSLDVVAHRTADASRQPVITVFPNDVSPTAPNKVRLVVSHVAVAPPADIRVDGDPLFRNVANGESLSLVVPAKECKIDVVPTATTGPAILAPIDLRLMQGTLTRVFAIGDATAGTADAVVQVISVGVTGSARPLRVQTGDGGQAADSFVRYGPSLGEYLLICLAVGLLATAGVLRGRRSPVREIGSRHSR
jgi:hypothetical protein